MKLSPIKTDLAEVSVTRDLLGIKTVFSQLCKNKACPSLNSTDTKQTMVLVLQNHDSWKCDQPSIKAGLHQCVKYWPVYLPGCLLHNYVKKCVKLCFGWLGFQVEHVHPSPGSVWFRRSIDLQNPGLLLSIPLLLQPAVPGRTFKQPKMKRVSTSMFQSIYFAFNHTPDCLQHWWEDWNNMEEMAWLQWRT